MKARLQLVWWWPVETASHNGMPALVWRGFRVGFERPGGSLSAVYLWRLYLGPLEVRRWHPSARAV